MRAIFRIPIPGRSAGLAQKVWKNSDGYGWSGSAAGEGPPALRGF